MKRLLITGAAGNLGRLARARLGGLAEILRLSDVVDMKPASGGEEVVRCDLSDYDAVLRLVEGCDGILHLGGRAVEGAFAEIRDANLVGAYNIYEAARRQGVKRVFFASSNHVTGFHARETRLDATAVMRPDTLYGVSKVYGEALARLYYDKFGIESALVRIGSCFPEPLDHRMLATWLSPDDFVSLVERVFLVQRIGCTVIYGVSANSECWWDNSHAAFIGWQPKDNAEHYRARLDATRERLPADHPAVRFQGGNDAAAGHFEDE